MPYLVLEYVDGEPIDAWLRAERALAVARAARLFLAGLRRGRTTRTATWWCTATSSRPTSWSTARRRSRSCSTSGSPSSSAAEPASDDRRRYRVRRPPLTPEYASPEQIRGDATTTATDVYSLGVLLFELLTGRRPYRVPTGAPEEWADAVLHQEAGRAPELGGDLEAILRRALAKTPADRYPTADAFADDLRRYLDGRPVIARPASAFDRTAKFVRRHRRAVALGAAAIVAIVATALVALGEAAAARRDRDLAERRFAQVRELAGVFLFDVHDAIAPLAGSTDARALLVETGLRYLDQLATEAGDDRGLLGELAGGYERLASLQGALVLPNLGRSRDALANQEKAVEIRARLATTNPSDAALARDLAAAELALGQALTRTGRVRDAPAHSARAAAALERAAALAPESPEATRVRGETLAMHGFLTAASGDLDRGEPILAQAVEVLARLHDARSDDLATATALSMALFRQAQVRAEWGGAAANAAADAILARALVIDRELTRLQPECPGCAGDSISDLAQHAEFLADAGEHEAALAGYLEVLALAEADRARDPSDALARRHLEDFAHPKRAFAPRSRASRRRRASRSRRRSTTSPRWSRPIRAI